MPSVLLSLVSRRVGEDLAEAIAGVGHQLARNDVHTETHVIAADGRATPELLASAGDACGADLIVLGAYGRSAMHQALFGSCTESVFENAKGPVLLMH